MAAPGTALPLWGGCIQPRCHEDPPPAQVLSHRTLSQQHRVQHPSCHSTRLPAALLGIFRSQAHPPQPPHRILLGTITPALPSADTPLIPIPLARAVSALPKGGCGVTVFAGLCHPPTPPFAAAQTPARYRGLTPLHPLRAPMERPTHPPRPNLVAKPAAPGPADRHSELPGRRQRLG